MLLCAPLNIPGAGRAKRGAGDTVARRVPFGWGTMALAVGPPRQQSSGVGGPWLRGVSLGTSVPISSVVVISIIWGFACVIPMNHGLILLRAAAGSHSREDGAEPITQRNRWDTSGFGGDNCGVTEPPRSPGCRDATEHPVGHRWLWQTAFLPASSCGHRSAGSELPTAAAGPCGGTVAAAPAAAAGHRSW